MLLVTKLMPPAVRADWVARPRLVDRLRVGRARALVALVAPAGFGKTTLAASLCAALGNPYAWLSLDPEDDEPARFWRYVLASLARAVPGAFEAPRSPAPPAGLFAELVHAGLRAAGPLTLVLDDYHHVKSPAVHGSIEALLDAAPSEFRLVLATRERPPLGLERRVVRGTAVTLGPEDLRFDRDETAGLLGSYAGRPVSGAVVQGLANRAHGWVAGMRLLLPAVAGSDDATLLASLGGSAWPLYEFVYAEVLARERPALRAFLERTAFLGRLCPELCDAVLYGDDTPETPSAQSLAELEQRGMLLARLDVEGEWYRCHALLAEACQAQLTSERPQLLAELAGRAARWCAGHGLLDDAVGYHLLAGDAVAAAQVVEARALELLLGQAEWAALEQWLRRLPPRVHARPRLIATRIMLAVLRFDLDAWRAELALLEAGLANLTDPGERAGFEAIALAVRAAQAQLYAGPEEAEGLARAARATSLPAEPLLYWIGMFHLDEVACFAGDLAWMTEHYDGELDRARAAGIDIVAGVLMSRRTRILVSQGEVARAAQIDAAVRERYRGMRHYSTGLSVGTAYIHSERGETSEAIAILEHGLAEARRMDELRLTLWVLTELSNVRRRLGDLAGARRALDDLASGLRREIGIFAGWIGTPEAQGLLLLAAGDRDALAEWARARGVEGSQLWLRHEGEHVVWSAALLEAGALDEAEARLVRVAVSARAGGRRRRLIEVLALRALVARARGDANGAQALLADALALADPDGHVAVFQDVGPALLPLLRAAPRSPYLERLIASVTRVPAVVPIEQLGLALDAELHALVASIGAPVAVVHLGPDGAPRLTEANAALHALLGAGDLLEPLRPGLEACAAKGARCELEREWRGAAGPMWIHMTFAPVGPSSVVVTAVDVTEEKSAQARLAAVRQALDRPAPAPSVEPGPAAEVPISEREREVLRLLAQGLSHKEIGAELDISAATVKVHARNLYRRLEVGSRGEAVLKARALGLL